MNVTNGRSQVDNRINRFAEAVSGVFHPFIVVIPTMVIVMLQQGTILCQAIAWTILAMCIVFLPLIFLIYIGVRSGRYSDPSVSMREQRHSLYMVAGFFMVVLLAVLVFSRAPIILIACFVSATLAIVFGFVINSYFTKLSLHSVAMAGCAVVLILTVPVLGIAMTLFAPLVAWARIRLRHHTPLQILIGWTVAVVSVVLIFHMFHLLS